MPNNSKEFKELQAKWYAKLASKLFNDIERNGHLKRSERFYALERCANEDVVEAKTEYYRIAGHFLHGHKFETVLEERIWELHAKGLSVRKIVTALKKKRFHVYRRKVDEIVRRLADEMVKHAREESISSGKEF